MLEQILTLLKEAIEKYGTKFLIALAAIGGIGYLVYLDKVPGLWGAVIMGAVALIYFAFRRKQEQELTCECDMEEPD